LTGEHARRTVGAVLGDQVFRALLPEPSGTVASAAGGGLAPAAATSLERIQWITALDDYPVRRNLLITQAYHDLSGALDQALGGGNVNWCTFATWASRCAGRFVRNEQVPAHVQAHLGPLEPVRVELARTKATLVRAGDEDEIDDDGLLELVRDVVHSVSTLVTAGNLAVFGELAPVFSRALDLFAADAGPAALDPLVETLEPGPSERGGQSLLQSALRYYAAARVEPDMGRKAARILLANAQIGLHEQIRLQPFIAGSIHAPIREALDETLEESGSLVPAPLRDEVHAVMSRILHPLAHTAGKLWAEFVTQFVMTLPLPSGTVMLGRALPPPPGAPLYPTSLDPIVDDEATEFLMQHGAHDPHSAGDGAVDWATLSDRMRFILDLFRSRQCDLSLLDTPFTAGQRDALLAGRHVDGPL
jgi:hypothetical protein